MKGFGIYVKNNLLEPKHVEAMGESVWLYLWLLDKMTSVSEAGIGKVMKGQPVSYEFAAQELGVGRQVYLRWVAKLRLNGYVKTLRTPYGLVFTIQKAEKIFGNTQRSIKNDTSPAKRSIKNDTRDVSKSILKMRQNRTSNNNNTSNNTSNNTNTNVLDPSGLGPKPSYGKPEINELFGEWSKQCGYDIESKVAANRRAASNLLKKHGHDKLIRLIAGVSMAQADPYAPGISDFCDLQAKSNQLVKWGKTKMHDYAQNKGLKI